MKEYRNASGQLTFDFINIDAASYDGITRDLVREFKLRKAGVKYTGLDEIFQTFRFGFKRVGLEWDIWSGYIVCAKSETAELLAKEIALFINSNYSE